MSGALALAEQIRTTVPEGRLLHIDRLEDIQNITLSMGLAHGGTGDHLDDLLHRADAALYTAKRSGGNRVSPEAAPGADARDDEFSSSQKGTELG
jgi:diguanylate cyclase